MCWTNYINPSLSLGTPSKSGLYADGLPGVTLNLLDDLTKDEQNDFEEFWDYIYALSKVNFINDVQGRLADKFHVELKLATRETSKYLTTENTGSALAGITLEYTLPKYAKIQILTVGLDAIQAYESPEFELKFYEDDSSGELLHTVTQAVNEGKNTIDVYTDFNVDKVFVAYDPGEYRLNKTENRYFATCNYLHFDKLSCTFPCYGQGYNASVFQINGGGLNVKFVVYCSIEKFICENINIFKTALWYRIGVDLIRERLLSDRFNRWTTLTAERAEQLLELYSEEYKQHTDNAVKNLRIQEDDICFECKSSVSASPLLP